MNASPDSNAIAPGTIPIEQFPPSANGFPKLFADYLTDFPKVSAHYGLDYRNPEKALDRAKERASSFPFRVELTEVLRDQNKRFGSGDKAIANIESLSQTNTLAVVTGQQVGILGGPLYTIYKTLTAVRLCERLRTSMPDLNFVPVFWLEGEDHDFEEMNHINILNAESTVQKVEYLIDGKPLERNIGAVGELLLGADAPPFFEKIKNILPGTEFKNDLLTGLQEAYASGNNFAKAFALLLNRFFPDLGIVFLYPNDARLKRLLRPVFKKELSGFPAVSQLIIDRSAKLETNYHAQIKPKSINLFCFHKGGRYLIEPREHDFSLKGTRQYFTTEQLMAMIEETPELLSPNVALRPICQDTVLPTFIYVGGPSEVSYFAQLLDVYKHFGLQMPIIYPRATATIVEGRLEKTLENYSLSILSVFGDIEKVYDKVIDQISEVNIEEIFKNASGRMVDVTKELQFGIEQIDPTLSGPLDGIRTKIEGQLQVLKEKTVEAQKRRHETALRQISRVGNSIYPNGNFQERELNIISFLNKYGPSFLKKIEEELKIDLFAHQLIRL
jgi:bacillithiol biosynthesis cysteine-adding enzyme BshC